MRKCVKNFNLGIMPKSRQGHILFVSVLVVTAMHLYKWCHFWDSRILFCLMQNILFPAQKKKETLHTDQYESDIKVCRATHEFIRKIQSYYAGNPKDMKNT